MKTCRLIMIALTVIVWFGFAQSAAAVSIVSGSETADFANTSYSVVKFVVPGSALETAGATAVSISSSQMTGDAWGDHVGWIRLNSNGTAEHAVVVACNGTTATLSGYGYGENTGVYLRGSSNPSGGG